MRSMQRCLSLLIHVARREVNDSDKNEDPDFITTRFCNSKRYPKCYSHRLQL